MLPLRCRAQPYRIPPRAARTSHLAVAPRQDGYVQMNDLAKEPSAFRELLLGPCLHATCVSPSVPVVVNTGSGFLV